MERAALSISGRVSGSQTPSDGRIEPELEQDVIGFQRGVGGEFRAPVAVALLKAGEIDCRPALGLFGG